MPDGSWTVIPTVVLKGGQSSTGTVARETLKRQRNINDQQLQVCALNQPLRFAYGLNRVGAMLLKPVVSAGSLFLPHVIADGGLTGIDAIVKVEMGDEALPDGATFTGYLGAPGQGVDTALANAWAVKGKTYADTLPGIAWGHLKLAQGKSISLGNIAITFRGLKLYDPRLDSTNGGSGSQRLATPSTWVYSANSALVLADFLSNATYGRGETVDWQGSAAAFNACDVAVGGLARCETHTVIDTAQDVQDVEDWLRAYARCWVVREGGVARLVADQAGSVVYSLTNAVGSANYLTDSIAISQSSLRQTPTVVTVAWTDTTTTPWKEQEWTEAGADSATRYDEERVSMPGCHTAGQARREAMRRLNEYITSDLGVSLTAVDEAMRVQVGDIVSLTDGGGFAAKPFRVQACPPSSPGRYALRLKEYDAAVYADVVAIGPTNPDTDKPSIGAPPAVTGTAVAEDIYQVETGRWYSRLVGSWDDMTAAYPYVANYAVTVMDGPDVVIGPLLVPATQQTFTSSPLKENVTYTLLVQIVSLTGATGDAGMASVLTNGKLAVPTDAKSITGYEIGGECRFTIDPPTDRDLELIEYRWGPVGTPWASMQLLERVPAPSIRYTTRVIPTGVWDVAVKGRDSIHTDEYPYGQESVNDVRCTISVTSDANAFVAAEYAFASPLLFNMTGSGPWQTDFAQTWAALFPSAMSTYTNPLLTYHTAGTSVIVTETYDVGSVLTGDWAVTPVYTDVGGTAQVAIDVNSTGGDSPLTVTGASNATPIVLTCTNTYLAGDEIVVASVAGNTAANGRWIVGSGVTGTTIPLVKFDGSNSTGNGTYTSGGTSTRWQWSRTNGTVYRGAARYVRMRILTTGAMIVSSLGTIRANLVARGEQAPAPVTTNASGPTTISLSRNYLVARSIKAGIIGTSAATWSYDKVEVSGGRGMPDGKTLRFDGVNDYVTMGVNSVHSFNNGSTSDLPFSVQCSVYFEAWSNYGLVCKANLSNPSAAGEWVMYTLTDGRVIVSIMDTTTGVFFQVISSVPIPIRLWTHIAFTYSGNGAPSGCALYINGVKDTPTQALSGGGYVRMRTAAVPLLLGAIYNSGSFAWFLNGKMDEVRLWNKQLSDVEVAGNYNVNISASTANLVGLWKLDDNTGTTATDSTSNAKNGTLTNGPTWRPLDGFDLYIFNGAGAQVSAQATWEFTGA